jgi:hydroxymethylbilane synthase
VIFKFKDALLVSIRIGTRGSKLALWQAEWVAGQLQNRGHDVELKIISTKGDVSTESLSQVGGQGLFTKEIQRALLTEAVDVAVHSLKDLPTTAVDGLCIAAVPERETTADCLISREDLPFTNLPSGARVGTGSSRRGAQLLAWRKDIAISDIRGNVDSRLRKLEEGQYDAIVLAAAGLTRLKLQHLISEELPQERMLPAIGQGALGLECRSTHTEVRLALHELNHTNSFAEVAAERSLLRSLLAGCLAPVAAIAKVTSTELRLVARVLSLDGQRVLEESAAGPAADAERIGETVAEALHARGAAEIIRSARSG